MRGLSTRRPTAPLKAALATRPQDDVPIATEPEVTRPIPPVPAGKRAHPPVAVLPPAPSAAFPARALSLRRAQKTIVSDFAVHGWAYIGVLLTFIGTLGFALFAFGTVNAALRPVAELAIPLFLFGSAWFLRRRRSDLVAASLELLGGTVTPIAVIASFSDGAPVPPDLHGSALAVGAALSSLVLTAVYFLVSQRRPQSALRYLVAPMTWLAVWGAGLLFQDGPGVRERFSAAQLALTACAIAATLLASAWKPNHPLARATDIAALPGIVILYGLTLLFSAQSGWSWIPVAAASLAVLVAAELLTRRFGGARGVTVIQGLALGGIIGVGIHPWGAGVAGMVATLAYSC